MHELVRNILPSFVCGIAAGSAFIPVNFGQNWMWKSATQQGITRAKATGLYVAMLIGGLVYLAAVLAATLACIRFIVGNSNPAVVVWIGTAVVTFIVQYKMKWFRPVPNSYRQFVGERPPAD